MGSHAENTSRDIDLLVIGELNADVIVDCGTVEPRYGQVESLVEDAVLVLGSSGAITACGAAKLGARVTMIGLVGSDWLGSFVLDRLEERGVDTRWCRRRDTRRTGMSIVLRKGSDRAILTFPGEIGRLAADDIPTTALAACRHLHVSSYFLQQGLWSGLPVLLHAAQEGGATTSIDPNWDPAESWDQGLEALLPSVDYLLPNEAEIVQIAGLRSVEESAASVAAHGTCVVVKRGGGGALLVDVELGEQLTAEAASIEIADTTGAGDTFNAGFLTGLLSGKSRAEALRFANAAAALSTRSPGGTASQPTHDEAAALAATLAVSRSPLAHPHPEDSAGDRLKPISGDE